MECQTLLRYDENLKPVFKSKKKFDTLDDAEEKSRYLNKHLPMHYPYDFRPISIRTLPTNVRFYHKPIVLDNKLKSKSKSIDAFSY